MWHSASVFINFAERAGKAHREPHRRSQGQRSENEARAIHKKGRNWITIHCQKLNNDLLVRCWPEFESDHFQSRKKGVTKCDTILLIFEWKFHHLRYGQICPKVPLQLISTYTKMSGFCWWSKMSNRFTVCVMLKKERYRRSETLSRFGKQECTCPLFYGGQKSPPSPEVR